jgi:hypothetical protein
MPTTPSSAGRPQAIVRPHKVYDFAALSRRDPLGQQPGDRLDAQFANIIDAVNAVAQGLDELKQPWAFDGLTSTFKRELVDFVGAHVQADAADAHAAMLRAQDLADSLNAGLAAQADEARRDASTLENRRARDVAQLNDRIDRLEARLAGLPTGPAPAPLDGNATINNPLLGYGAGGFYAADAAGATATASDYAQVSIDWAEHMPDTIPNQTMAINAVTGDHWSSRWWANRAANAFGQMAWWYQGAFPSPGPPMTPNDPTGKPLPVGAMYYDTTRGQMMVWTGSLWTPIGAPTPSAVSTLFYQAASNQTVFPLTAGDLYGHSVVLKADGSNGVEAYLNGVRLTFDDGTGKGDYTVAAATSTITLLKPTWAGAILAVDVLIPPAQLAPGAVLIKRITPIVPDGVTTAFVLTCADASAINIQSPQELYVSWSGVSQEPVVAYATTANSITFASAPPADAYVYILWMQSSGSGGAVAEAPNNGTLYGRKNLGWSPCAPITGHVNSAVTNPTGTASSTFRMMGLNTQLTANVGTAATINLDGQITNSSNNSVTEVVVCWGTGTPPLNGAAQAGTVASQAARYKATNANDYVPFSLTCLVTGLASGTTYWLDAAVRAPSGGTAAITDLDFTVVGLA